MSTTVLHRLAKWAEEDPGSVAQTFKRDGQRIQISAKEYMERVYHLALFLESRGMGPSDAGCIFSYNSPQWAHLDLAVLLLGAKSAGIYPNSTAKDILYILGHTEAKVLGVQNKEYFHRIADDKGHVALPSSVKLVIGFDNDTSYSPLAVGYETAIQEGKKLARLDGLQKFLSKLDPDAGAFMIYTSGTTGNPKGALLSQDNLVYTSDLAARYWNLPYGRGSMFSFLPLCHIAEKLQSIGVGISQRYAVNFATKFENVGTELPEVQPTLLLCVPRLWEKMMEGVVDKVSKGTGLKKTLAVWALATGARVAEAKYSGRSPSPLDRVQLALGDKLVLSKIRAALGLTHAEILASGAAALPAHVAKWFRSLGLEILEDFGQTESTGVICMTEPGVDSLGTVGKAVPGLEFKLAADGEVLTRGRHVFKGYFKDDAATQATLEGGWLHTGDVAALNDKGQVKIQGRKKEIMKTSGGKMIAPLPIEERLKAAPPISQVCIVGDGRKYVSALITLSESKLNELKARGNGVLAGRIVEAPEVVGEIRKYVDEINDELAGYEQIKRFTVLTKEFSIVDGEMTPTLKMKRGVIERRYQDVIDSMYG